MLGLMQDQPLLISSLIEYAERHHGDAEIVSRAGRGRPPPLHLPGLRRAFARRSPTRWTASSAAAAATASPRWPGTATATSSCTTA